jgi:hypothetical protein
LGRGAQTGRAADGGRQPPEAVVSLDVNPLGQGCAQAIGLATVLPSSHFRIKLPEYRLFADVARRSAAA